MIVKSKSRSVSAVLSCVITNDPRDFVEMYRVAVSAVAVRGISTTFLAAVIAGLLTVVVVVLAVSVTVPLTGSSPRSLSASTAHRADH
jgi:hypothetical protein